MSVRVAVGFAVKVYKHIKTKLEINEISITFPETSQQHLLARNSSHGGLKINVPCSCCLAYSQNCGGGGRHFEKNDVTYEKSLHYDYKKSYFGSFSFEN